MPTYDEMMDYILDQGLECKCCKHRQYCTGIRQGPNGPIFPVCSEQDFNELLIHQDVERIYKEAHAHD